MRIKERAVKNFVVPTQNEAQHLSSRIWPLNEQIFYPDAFFDRTVNNIIQGGAERVP